MKAHTILFCIGAALSMLCSSGALANEVPCSADKMKEILRNPAEDNKMNVKVDCSMTLASSNVIKKTIILTGSKASNTTINCNKARIDNANSVNSDRTMIRVVSKRIVRADGTCVRDAAGYCTYESVENVTFRGCKVTGRTEIIGIDGDEYPAVTWHADYTEKARANAPKNIKFEDMEVTAENDIAYYVFPGVTGFQLLNSTLTGSSNSVAIYLDAESIKHNIRGNTFSVNTDREIIAIDGSGYSKIINNYFIYTSDGGIYLYRNCGEPPGGRRPYSPGYGSIRHATPRNNVIVNNRFSDGDYDGANPAVFMGSRNGNRDYCDADLRPDGTEYPWGSSVSNYDYARFNVVMQNQISNGSVAERFRASRPTTDMHNEVSRNELSAALVNRKAGCYLPTGYTTDFLLHGQTGSMVKTASGAPACVNVSCNDGDLAETGSCTMYSTPFSCQATDSNNGCAASKLCPTVNGRQTTVVGAKAGCNLEIGNVTAAELAAIEPGRLEVIRASDVVSEGKCYAADTTVTKDFDMIRGGPSQARLYFGCREHDDNGGDCYVSGTLYCK